MVTEVQTSCRICSGCCALRVTLDEQKKIVSIKGDKSNTVTNGYACVKGTHAHDAHYSDQRLLHPLKRQPDGSFTQIPLSQALDEIAEKLNSLIGQAGPASIAGFRGTSNYLNLTAYHMLPDWLSSLGSSAFYSTMTIDQSAKWVAAERLGVWGAGIDPFDTADVLMMVGANPLVSLGTFNFPMQDPLKAMRKAKERGLKTITIDPRVTETAKYSDIHLQPLPGEDAAIIAGLIKIILDNRWHDTEFCQRHVHGLKQLHEAVAAFTVDHVCQRAGLEPDALISAAQLFAQPLPGRRKRGTAATGTGANMCPHSNLVEHLVQCLNVICGRFAREGDLVRNPGVIGAPMPHIAKVYPPQRSWEKGWTSQLGPFGMLYGQRMSALLPHDVLSNAGADVKALFVVGGNPVNAIPDQSMTTEALRALDLLVTVDPFMTNTAKLSHYIIPPKMMFERSDLPNREFEPFTTQTAYAQYSPAIIQPPEGSEVVDDWFVFWSLAQRMGTRLVFDGVPLDLQHPPSNDDLLRILTRNSVIAFDEIKAKAGGHEYLTAPSYVQAAPPNDGDQFDIAPEDVSNELLDVLNEKTLPPSDFRLSVRRMREVHNTTFQNIPSICRNHRTNPAYMNPNDMAELGLSTGDVVALSTSLGTIQAICDADPSLRASVVSIAHGWGPLPDDSCDPKSGVNINLIVGNDLKSNQTINAMPVMTGIPVHVQKAGTAPC